MAFTPKTKDSYKNEIKNYLLEGYALRRDARDETPIEVLPRETIEYLSSMGNIGSEKSVVAKIKCSHSVLSDVVNELREEYSVRKVWCSFSGCCQYSTYAYYVD